MTIINLRDFYYWYTQDEYPASSKKAFKMLCMDFSSSIIKMFFGIGVTSCAQCNIELWSLGGAAAVF